MQASLLIQTLSALIGTTPSAKPDCFQAWKESFSNIQCQYTTPWSQALVGGFHGGCVGYAFAAGYQAALNLLVPEFNKNASKKLAALCVTEESGNHPKAITTAITSDQDQLKLTGAKKFITGGQQADVLLVAAKQGQQQNGLPNIKMAMINADAAGVTINPMPPLPFVPEIDHATVDFAAVTLQQSSILPGDGYTRYVKPFRTIEDIHVCLALCGYFLGVSQTTQLDHRTQEQLLACIASHAQLSELPANDPSTHLLVAGARQQLENLIPTIEQQWQQKEDEHYQNWLRDKGLLKVAASAREKRTTTAWQTLKSGTKK